MNTLMVQGVERSGIKSPYPNEGAQRQLPTSLGGLLGRRGFRKREVQMSVTLVVKRGTATRRELGSQEAARRHDKRLALP